MSIAAGGVEIDEAEGFFGVRLQQGYAIAELAGGMADAEEREIMTRRSGYLCLSLHVDGLGEEGREVGKVHSHASREVNHAVALVGRQQSPYDVGLVFRRTGTATLLQGNARGEKYAWRLCPSWHFVAQTLPSLYLPQYIRRVEIRTAGDFQRYVLNTPKSVGENVFVTLGHK